MLADSQEYIQVRGFQARLKRPSKQLGLWAVATTGNDGDSWKSFNDTVRAKIIPQLRSSGVFDAFDISLVRSYPTPEDGGPQPESLTITDAECWRQHQPELKYTGGTGGCPEGGSVYALARPRRVAPLRTTRASWTLAPGRCTM